MQEGSYSETNSSQFYLYVYRGTHIYMCIEVYRCTQNAHTFKNTVSDCERGFKGFLE